jgi:type IV fimbrial biogenesis protein FimT
MDPPDRRFVAYFVFAKDKPTILHMPTKYFQPKGERGVTLLELLVTVSLVAIVLSLAVPPFQSLFARNRMAIAVNTLLNDLNFARVSALTRQQTVSLCPDDTGTADLDCSGGTTWHTGYLVFADPDGDGNLASDTDIIRVSQGDADALVTITGEESSVRFRASGSACPNVTSYGCGTAMNDTNGNSEITFQFRDSVGIARARDLDINLLGRATCSRQCPDTSWVGCAAQCP